MKQTIDESDSDESFVESNKQKSELQKEKQKNSISPPLRQVNPTSARRPGSAESRGSLTAVNSMEHASLVIKSLRSFSHSQKSYHRTACQDDKIISTLRQFDQIVIQKSAEVDKAKRVQGLIAATGSGSAGAAVGTGAGLGSRKTEQESGDDDSSDEENDKGPHHKQGKTSRGQVDKTAQMVWGKATDAPAERSVEESLDGGGSIRGSCVVTKHSRGDSSDDDLLGGLDSDDEEDMAALMQGFVAPSVSQAAIASSNTLKKEKSVKGTAARSSNSSAIHDLEDSMDSASFPSYLNRQNADDTSRSDSNRGTQSRSHVKKRAANSTNTGTTNQERSRSAGNPGGTAVAGSSAILMTGGRAKGARGSSGGGRPSCPPSNKSGSFSDSFSQGQDVSSVGGGSSSGTSSNAGAGGNKKHNVMITPGQRIRVRPSRKNKSSNYL